MQHVSFSVEICRVRQRHEIVTTVTLIKQKFTVHFSTKHHARTSISMRVTSMRNYLSSEIDIFFVVEDSLNGKEAR